METALDLGSIGWSAYDLVTKPSWRNAAYLAWDVGAAAIPGVPGSYVAKAGKVAKAVGKSSSKTVRSALKGTNKSKYTNEGIFVIETKFKFLGNIQDEVFVRFLKNISDKWLFFGNPVDEAFASDTTEGCNFIKNGIKMINIFY